jgi:hypothetical protein
MIDLVPKKEELAFIIAMIRANTKNNLSLVVIFNLHIIRVEVYIHLLTCSILLIFGA